MDPVSNPPDAYAPAQMARLVDGVGIRKATLPLLQLWMLGLLAGAFIAFGAMLFTLVCLAVWLCFSARDVSGEILSIVFPISAFVALGFEHSVANMYVIPIGMLAGGGPFDLPALAGNLVPVSLGNIVGGSGFVAIVYWIIYLRGKGEAMP